MIALPLRPDPPSSEQSATERVSNEFSDAATRTSCFPARQRSAVSCSDDGKVFERRKRDALYSAPRASDTGAIGGERNLIHLPLRTDQSMYVDAARLAVRP